MRDKYKNILVPIDGSKKSEDALLEAVEIAKRNNGHIQILNVIDITEFNFEAFAYDMDEVSKGLKRAAETTINESKKIIPKDISVKSTIKSGKPKTEIVDYAEASQVDLILIGATGLGRVERALVGSTTAFVVNNAHCNVMVVR